MSLNQLLFLCRRAHSQRLSQVRHQITKYLRISLDPLDTSSKKRKRLHGMVAAMYHVTFEERY